ncbi:Zinc finger, CCHC-type [Sesbania bispinosa]|nr:Zinc finger, CCHC-type [Sesbania bispinosa]
MEVNRMENFHTDEESLEGATIQLESSGSESIELARKTLVGRILWDKPLNKGAVKQMLIKACGEDAEELRIMDMGVNVFIFYFSDKKKARSIMEKGPWNVMGHLVSLQYWIPEASVYEINYDLVTFWVQMHGIPLEFMTTNNVTHIVGMIGEVKEVEDPKVEGVLLRSFMRVRVAVNVKKPLVTGFWVPRKDLPKTWVLVKYEKLQDFCYKCGVIGHDPKQCKKEKLLASFDNSRARENTARQGKVRPGLGPSSLQLLNVATEDIGLQQHVVIMDCLSPTNRYDGPILTPVDIAKCRDAWMELELGRRKYKSRDKAPKGDVLTNPYIVEFPPDEEEVGSGVTIHKEEESQVIEGFNISLSLKRDRNADFTEAEKGSGRKVDNSLNRIRWAIQNSELLQSKAEEAGQTMPPPQP